MHYEIVMCTNKIQQRWIDWLVIAQRPASSISAIFRERTSSIIYKNYIKMREEMGQPVNDFWLSLKKHAKLGRDEQFSLLYRLQCAYCFSRCTKKPSLMEDPSGYERWWIIRNSPGHFLGTRPNGDIWIFVNGGDWKGPATLPARTSLVILSVSVLMFCLTEIRFSWILISVLLENEF